MSDGTKALIGIMLTAAAVLCILGIWTNDERWGGTAAVVAALGLCPWGSYVIRRGQR
jgi:hypothetical protein